MKEAYDYSPPIGININWLEWDNTNGQCVAEFHGSDKQIKANEKCNMAKIDAELVKLKPLATLARHPKSPAKIETLEINMNSPNILQAIKDKVIKTRQEGTETIGILDEG